jgi:phage terminase large subunit GpA-like protein
MDLIDYSSYRGQMVDILEDSVALIKDIRPSVWTEQNLIMKKKPFEGPFRYDRTPYTREIVDCLDPNHPARVIAVMKGAQIGFSAGVIYPGVLYIMNICPGNTIVTVGDPELIGAAMEKIDEAIDNSGSRYLIKPQVMRNRNNKSGDTNFQKDFPLGYVRLISADKHKAMRQRDLQYGFLDDYEAIKMASKESGATDDLIEQRFASFSDQMKIFKISTPERAESSNINTAYKKGDQRKYNVECPCCHEPIVLEWKVKIDEKNFGGIVWEPDNHGNVIESSVGYVCQLCAGYFQDRYKDEMLGGGIWVPTAVPRRPDYRSYHINSLYAPLGMYSWYSYAAKYVDIQAEVDERLKESRMRTFKNVVEGLPYESETEQVKPGELQQNCRPYLPGVIPEELSIKDGNGRIVLITMACDLNGRMKGFNKAEYDDVRLDYQLYAWAESGARYSFLHGSLGTFVPRENTLADSERKDRERWSYRMNVDRSVWPLLEEIRNRRYMSDTGRPFTVGVCGVDCGAYTEFAEAYLDWTIRRTPENPAVGVRGQKEDKYNRDDVNTKWYDRGRQRTDIYYIRVGLYKELLAKIMAKKWLQGEDQPPGYMNFPTPGMFVCPSKKAAYSKMGMSYDGDMLYSNEGFFKHYEAEKRELVDDKDGGKLYRWVKTDTAVQNHFWDTDVYNMAERDIIVNNLGDALRRQGKWTEKDFLWVDYVRYVLRQHSLLYK